MPVHDWTKVAAGIFHDFHHAWIEEIKRALNSRVLPPDYYALAEQRAAGFGPDVLTLERVERPRQAARPQRPPQQTAAGETSSGTATATATAAATATATATATLLSAPPQVQIVAETDVGYYRRRQKSVVVRHASGDRVVAVVEIVSPGNKASSYGVQSFVQKACQLLESEIHLLVIDLHPPASFDPAGMHGQLWEAISGQEYEPPAGKPLTLAAYEASAAVKAYVEPLAVGDLLKDMPLFLLPGRYVLVPLEQTYRSAFEAMPRRWRDVLEPPQEGRDA